MGPALRNRLFFTRFVRPATIHIGMSAIHGNRLPEIGPGNRLHLRIYGGFAVKKGDVQHDIRNRTATPPSFHEPCSRKPVNGFSATERSRTLPPHSPRQSESTKSISCMHRIRSGRPSNLQPCNGHGPFRTTFAKDFRSFQRFRPPGSC